MRQEPSQGVGHAADTVPLAGSGVISFILCAGDQMNARQWTPRSGVADRAGDAGRSRTARYRALYAMCLMAWSMAGCGDRAEPSSRASGDASRFVVTSSASVTMPPHLGSAVLKQCTRRVGDGITGYWRPDTTDIRKLEEDLPAVLARIAKRSERELFDADEYYRQYVGIVLNGRRLIYVNGFHKGHVHPRRLLVDTADPRIVHSDTAAWREEPVNVCDGGSLFFGVEYDAARRRFGRIEYNERA